MNYNHEQKGAKTQNILEFVKNISGIGKSFSHRKLDLYLPGVMTIHMPWELVCKLSSTIINNRFGA